MTNSCNCETRELATETREMTCRVQGRPEVRSIAMCRKCAEATDAEARSLEPFTREYHVSNITRLAGEIRSVVRNWDESLTPSKRQADEMLLWSRSLAAELSALATIDQKGSRNA